MYVVLLSCVLIAHWSFHSVLIDHWLLLTVIKGKTARSVTSAITRIEVLADSGRQKTDFTHFVSVPMTHPVVQRHYQKFQEQVLTQFSVRLSFIFYTEYR